MPVVVDSNGWISWLLGDANAEQFGPAITGDIAPIVPSVVMFEVVRWFRARADDSAVRLACEHMLRGEQAPLGDTLAISAALLASEHRLAMADAIILATAQAHGAEVWTMDADFRHAPGVRYLPRVTA
ncbi:type II toxin-antitoxin system VapC family toxin [Sandarakinorhabdus sp.]|uniref:type II toxin-antitoxin system VapC family toxin n=1 Tax=Sandarakinorhabdus sp. TaxID=1916663 RepID=UPI00286EA980|nr:type II toxin-antitoxin system VapC family toxin [Sandarakinorhabdus sp.]